MSSSDRNQNGGNNRKAEKAARIRQQQQQSTEGGLFLDPNGHYKTPMLLLSVSVPLFLTGHWVWGLVALLITFLGALRNAMEEMIQEEDKHKIRHDVMNANDVLYEMMAVEESIQRVVGGASKSESKDSSNNNNNDDNEDNQETIRQGRLVILTGLGALAKKYSKQLRREEQRKCLLQETTTSKDQQHQQQQSSSSSSSSPLALASSSSLLDPELPLLCQQAAYIGLRLFGQNENDDDDTTVVVAAAISLAALVAKDVHVRQRHLYQADVYGLDVPIRAMKLSLTRARKLKVQQGRFTKKDKAQVAAADPAVTAAHHQEEEEEEAAAELQRKSCLFLGALADDSNELACLIANEGGLQAILEAADWFRYHVDVANWALWAIFILCFENLPNKVILVRDVGSGGGIPIVLQTMRNCPDSIDVARHGIAILFDLMRQDNNDIALVSKNAAGLDVWKIRNLALAAGLHPVLAHAVQQFGDQAMDIKMMGGEILTGTDYQGDDDIALATPQVAQQVEKSSMLE